MNELENEKKSIIAHPRDYKEPLHPQIQELLDAISDFEFTTPNGLVFKMSDINAKVPVYLDEEKSRKELRITWNDLNKQINELRNILNQLPPVSNGGKKGREKSGGKNIPTTNYYYGLLVTLEKNRDDYLKTYPNPSPNDIVTIPLEVALLGYYTREGRSHNPEIVLLMNTLGNKRENAKTVAITLIHEMFHAFYDYDLNQKDTDVPYVEEPLTEYAMLSFLDELQKEYKKYYSLYSEARDNVYRKKFSIGLGHYGFGSYLWEYEKEWGETLKGIHWIEAFHKVKYKLPVDSGYNYREYTETFSSGFYPFQNEYYQMELLRCVLLEACGSSLGTLEKSILPFGAQPYNLIYGRNACWGKADGRDDIILDGDFSNVNPNSIINERLGSIYRIILWDHFMCNDFAVVKKIIEKYNFPCVKLSSHNNNFFLDKGGAILNAAKTALFYCPVNAKKCYVPDGVTEIVASAFDNCATLQHVEIPSSVNKIPEETFKDCKSLNEKIVFNQKLLWVPNNATDYVVPAGVTEISKVAFKYCKQLQHLTIPDEIKVDEGLYDDCESLDSEIVLGQKLLWVPNNATEYTIPDGVKGTGRSAFRHCKRLEHLTIPPGVVIVPDKAFRDCESLKHDVVFNQKLLCAPKHVAKYDIPDGVTAIDDAAFAHCRRLTRLTIPASMETVQSSAFGIGHQIRELVFKGNELPEADKRFFYVFGSSCVIWVPKGCKQTFKRRFQSFAVKEYTLENECFKEI